MTREEHITELSNMIQRLRAGEHLTDDEVQNLNDFREILSVEIKENETKIRDYMKSKGCSEEVINDALERIRNSLHNRAVRMLIDE